MEQQFNAKDIIMQKAMAQSIIDELNIVRQKNLDSALKLANNYTNLNNLMVNAKTLFEAEKYSNQIDEIKEKIISIFAINDKIDILIKRNEIRIKYFDWRINVEKIIKFEVNKKQILTKIEGEKIKVEDNLLNLNFSSDSKVPVFYNGQNLMLKNGKLSLEIDENYQALKTCEDVDFQTITDKFPMTLMTITDNQLTDIKFKERVLKQLITIIDDKLKKKSIDEINEYFGSPLDFTRQTPNNPNEFIDGIINLLRVRVKQYFLKNYPQVSREVNSRLECDEQSYILPHQYFVSLDEEETIEQDEEEEVDEELLEYIENNDYEEASNEEIDDFNNFLMDLLGDEGEDDES